MPGFLAAVPFGKPGWREYSHFAALPQDGLEPPAGSCFEASGIGVNLSLDTARKPCEIRMMRPPHKKGGTCLSSDMHCSQLLYWQQSSSSPVAEGQVSSSIGASPDSAKSKLETAETCHD
jgi:hypothetical protein